MQRTLGAIAGLMASAMLLLKAPLLVPAVAGGLALVWGREWNTWNNHAAAFGGMLLGLTPGSAGIFGMPTSAGAKRSGCGAEMAPGGFFQMPAKAGLGWRVPMIEVLEGLALAAAAALRPDLGLALASEPLGPLVSGLPADPGRSHSSAAHSFWYSHPLWLPIALLCAPLLVWLVERPFVSKSAPRVQIPTALAVVAASNVLVRAGLLLLLLWLSGTQQHRQQPCAYRSLAGALGLGWCVGGWWLRSATPQRRRLGVIYLSCGNVAALALLFQSPLVVGAQRNLARTTCGSLGPYQPWKRDQAEGLRRTSSLNWYAEHGAFRGSKEPQVGISATRPRKLQYRRPSRAMDLADCR